MEPADRANVLERWKDSKWLQIVWSCYVKDEKNKLKIN